MQDFIYLAVWIGCYALVLFALRGFNIRALAYSWAPSSRLAWLCLFITSDREKAGRINRLCWQFPRPAERRTAAGHHHQFARMLATDDWHVAWRAGQKSTACQCPPSRHCP